MNSFVANIFFNQKMEKINTRFNAKMNSKRKINLTCNEHVTPNLTSKCSMRGQRNTIVTRRNLVFDRQKTTRRNALVSPIFTSQRNSPPQRRPTNAYPILITSHRSTPVAQETSKVPNKSLVRVNQRSVPVCQSRETIPQEQKIILRKTTSNTQSAVVLQSNAAVAQSKEIMSSLLNNGKRVRPHQSTLRRYVVYPKKQNIESKIKTATFSIDKLKNNTRKFICPSLTQKQIKLILTFLNDPLRYIQDELFVNMIMSSKIEKIPSYMVTTYLWYWGKILGKRKVNGVETLCISENKKLILPKEDYISVVKDAHQGTGVFIWAEVTRDSQGRSQHNDYHKTLKLISTDYGVGDHEFGMNESFIYDYIDNCTECTWKIKNLPTYSKVYNNMRIDSKCTDGCVPNLSIDEGNESNNINLETAPVSMIWPPRNPKSIWYDQKGLSIENNQYLKLLGVIRELGIEMGAMVQGDKSSSDRFLTKLYCADRFVKDTINKLVESDKQLSFNNFCRDYLELQTLYLAEGKLDVFLYDVNILALKYELAKHPTFVKMVNNSVSMFKNPADQMRKIQTQISQFQKTEVMSPKTTNTAVVKQFIVQTAPHRDTIITSAVTTNVNTSSTFTSNDFPQMTMRRVEIATSSCQKIPQAFNLPLSLSTTSGTVSVDNSIKVSLAINRSFSSKAMDVLEEKITYAKSKSPLLSFSATDDRQSISQPHSPPLLISCGSETGAKTGVIAALTDSSLTNKIPVIDMDT